VYTAIVFVFGTTTTGGKVYIASYANPNACEKMGKIYTFSHSPGSKAVTERHAIIITEWELFCLKTG
jgi:hypothetical protein